MSRNATWPGVWPGAATTSSEPTRSPAASSRVGSVFAPEKPPRSFASSGSPGSGVLSLRQQLRVARGDQDLDARQLGGERVEPADVVLVGVRERDADDRAARLPAAARIAFGAAEPHRRVDQRQAVVLLDEERVDDPEQARDADHARSSSATHSMCGVCGNMSTGRTRLSVQPASTSCAAFGASVVGLQET